MGIFVIKARRTHTALPAGPVHLSLRTASLDLTSLGSTLVACQLLFHSQPRSFISYLMLSLSFLVIHKVPRIFWYWWLQKTHGESKWLVMSSPFKMSFFFFFSAPSLHFSCTSVLFLTSSTALVSHPWWGQPLGHPRSSLLPLPLRPHKPAQAEGLSFSALQAFTSL